MKILLDGKHSIVQGEQLLNGDIAQPSRRAFLGGLAALGASAVFAGDKLWAQAGNPGRLDFHHHYVSPGWLKFLTEEHKKKTVMGFDVINKYTVRGAIEEMDKGGIATALLSVTTPGVWFGNIDATRRAARELNEFAAKMVSDYKGRFGQFAVLPLPDVDASLREIEYVYDTLRVDGIGFLSSYQDRWLGDASFAPVWEELNRRNAVVYTHATAPECCMWSFQPGVGPTVIELSSDLARTIVSVIESGTANRTPNVKYIWSHGGGTILAARYLGNDATVESLAKPAEPNSKLHHLRRFYYDTAAATDPVHLGLLKMVVPSTQIVFGTDVPWGTPANIVASLQRSGLSAEELRGVDRENGLRILPKYRA